MGGGTVAVASRVAAVVVVAAFAFAAATSGTLWAAEILPPKEQAEDQIEIVEGRNRTVYEYRQNGLLMMIKIVPKKGRPYYLVRTDGSGHFSDKVHSDLYPQWIIAEW
ncbi:MAG: DUF2782 domain-containing protein [Pseudomonadales bacterium]